MKSGLGTVLFLIFLTLKLTGLVAWSWLWVTAPIWLPLTVAVGMLGVAALLVRLANK